MDQNPQNSYNPVTLTQKEFDDKYWFNPLQMVTVVNPLPEMYPFMVELRHYEILPGSHMQYPGMIANVYLDQMSRILAQNDEKLGYIGDPNLRKIYYEKLIVDITDLAPQASVIPQYLRQPTSEKAPWDSSVGERASDIPRTQSLTPPIAPPAPEKPKEEIKEFEYNGLKFKSITDKEGATDYFKNDTKIDAAAFAKAASML